MTKKTEKWQREVLWKVGSTGSWSLVLSDLTVLTNFWTEKREIRQKKENLRFVPPSLADDPWSLVIRSVSIIRR